MTPEQAQLILREIDQFLKEVREDFNAVKSKQDHTNGDVTELKMWRARVEGALATAKYGHPLAVGMGTAAFTFALTRIF